MSSTNAVRTRRRAPRGFSLVFTMLVVALLTLLVAGAIVFTGSEQSAAVQRTRAERQSACLQAARNEFMSRIRVLSANTPNVSFNTTLPLPGGDTLTLRSGHISSASPSLGAVEEMPGVTKPTGGSQDLTNKLGGGGGFGGLGAKFYRITATCTDPTGNELEVEFSLRVGI